jgi:hypothetical protein
MRDISARGGRLLEGEQACPEYSRNKGKAAPLERGRGKNSPPGSPRERESKWTGSSTLAYSKSHKKSKWHMNFDKKHSNLHAIFSLHSHVFCDILKSDYWFTGKVGWEAHFFIREPDTHDG